MAEMRTIFTAIGISIVLLVSAAGVSAAPLYIQASSLEDQFATDTKPKLITMDSTDASAGITNKAGVVTVPEDGVYFVVAAGQIGTKSGAKGTVRLWLRQNGKDVDNSNCEQSILDPAFTTVLVSQGIGEFKKGDTVQAVFSGSAPGLGIIVRKPAGEAAVPSIIFSMYKLN
jgi:hypothetical protein